MKDGGMLAQKASALCKGVQDGYATSTTSHVRLKHKRLRERISAGSDVVRADEWEGNQHAIQPQKFAKSDEAVTEPTVEKVW